MKTFSKVFITVLLSISMLCGCASCATLEQVKKTQVQNALNSKNGQQITLAVEKYSQMYNIEPALIYAIIMTESGFNPRAVSSHGCSGLMQLNSNTFKARKVGNNIFSIEQNIHAGTKHLAGLIARYDGNKYKALAAYNMGGGKVHKDKPIPKAGKKYVDRIFYHRQIIVSVVE